MKIFLLVVQVLLVTASWNESLAAQDLDRLNRFVQTQTPSPASTAFREARDLIKDGEWQKAEARFNRFIAEFPKDREIAAALYWLAFALKQENKFPAADAALTRLIEQHSSSPWLDDARALRVEIAPRLKNSQLIEQGVSETNEEIKLAALQSLFEASPERALTLVADILKPGAGGSRLMKEGALSMLADSDAREAIPVLAQVARNDTDLRLRRKAIEALGDIDDPAALVPLKALALQSTDLVTARAALRAVGDHEAAGRSLLLEIVRSTAPVELRIEAIDNLDDLDENPAVVDELVKLLASEKDSRVLARLIEELGDIELPRAQTALSDLARTSPDTQVRRRAIEALANREDDNAAVASLVQLYDAEKDERLKETILEALGDSDEKPALQKLMQVATSDASLKLRKRAVNLIAKSNDPNAMKFLEQLLKKN